jgi:hypothetical protein
VESEESSNQVLTSIIITEKDKIITETLWKLNYLLILQVGRH